MNKTAVASLCFGVALATVAIAFASMPKGVTKVNGIEWRNSFESAVAEAKKTGKPILLLSMFGKIDEEVACANARTLRATLFKTPAFMNLVKNDVIPVWEMVREVPKVYIDLGKGKQVVRTVRGNAVMYVCNPDGYVVDALPGVYNEKDFIPLIKEAISLTKKTDSEVIAFHGRLGYDPRSVAMTVGKSVMESPTLELMGAPGSTGAAPKPSGDPKKLAFETAAKRLTDTSLTPMSAANSFKLATGKDLSDADTNKAAQMVMDSDSGRNVRMVRPVVHLYFGSLGTLPTPLQARDAVLENILKIPYKDPYFGLKEVLLPGTPN